MTEAQVYSWIFLSISYGGENRRDIAHVADGINHAFPTHKEIESSLRWLQEQGVVREECNRFSLTERGEALIERLRRFGTMRTWRSVSGTFENMLNPEDK